MTNASIPSGPILVVRPGISFWLETDSGGLTSTMSAFQDGVLEDAVCFDRSGSCWSVVEARLSGRPSLSDRIFPWRRVSVSIVYADPRPTRLDELKALLREVVDSENEFVDALETDVVVLRNEIDAAESFAKLLEVVNRATSESPPDR